MPAADDYLTKPFRPRELRARIEAMLRRYHQNRRPWPARSTPVRIPAPSTTHERGQP